MSSNPNIRFRFEKAKNAVKLIAPAVVLAAGLGASMPSSAKEVVYTLRTVTDGRIGNRSFSQARVTITFRGRTENVVRETVAGQLVYSNREGQATVEIAHGGLVTVAEFAPGEIYVQYNTSTGVVGFGSPISSTYPVALDCANSHFDGGVGCSNGDWNGDSGNYGTADALVDIANYPGDDIYYTVSALPTSLSKSTLLTGDVTACAVPYGLQLTCPSPAPRGLSTNQGAFFLQDTFGYTGSSSDINSGALRVEVITSSDDD